LGKDQRKIRLCIVKPAKPPISPWHTGLVSSDISRTNPKDINFVESNLKELDPADTFLGEDREGEYWDRLWFAAQGTPPGVGSHAVAVRCDGVLWQAADRPFAQRHVTSLS
jgi:hypothetical protein